MKYVIFIVLIAAILSAGCKDDAVSPWDNINNGAHLVNVQVDLQSGFAGKLVLIEINNNRVYYSILSELVSLAGPEASFSTYLPEGENNIFVFTQSTTNSQEKFSDSSRISIGHMEKYFVGLQISDSLKCIVQDSSFLYL